MDAESRREAEGIRSSELPGPLGIVSPERREQEALAAKEREANEWLAPHSRATRGQEYPFRLHEADLGRRGARRQFREARLCEELAAGGVDPGASAQHWARIDERLSEARLTQTERVCFLLHEWWGYEDRDIGLLLGVSQRHVRRLRSGVRTKLDACGSKADDPLAAPEPRPS